MYRKLRDNGTFVYLRGSCGCSMECVNGWKINEMHTASCPHLTSAFSTHTDHLRLWCICTFLFACLLFSMFAKTTTAHCPNIWTQPCTSNSCQGFLGFLAISLAVNCVCEEAVNEVGVVYTRGMNSWERERLQFFNCSHLSFSWKCFPQSCYLVGHLKRAFYSLLIHIHFNTTYLWSNFALFNTHCKLPCLKAWLFASFLFIMLWKLQFAFKHFKGLMEFQLFVLLNCNIKLSEIMLLCNPFLLLLIV